MSFFYLIFILLLLPIIAGFVGVTISVIAGRKKSATNDDQPKPPISKP